MKKAFVLFVIMMMSVAFVGCAENPNLRTPNAPQTGTGAGGRGGAGTDAGAGTAGGAGGAGGLGTAAPGVVVPPAGTGAGGTGGTGAGTGAGAGGMGTTGTVGAP